MPEWLTLLIGAGVITALVAAFGRIATQFLKSRSAKEARAEKRAQGLLDKQLQRRRDAYVTLLDEINISTVHQLSGGADRPLNADEFQRRMKMMRDIDLYGSEEVKGLSVNVASFLKRDIVSGEHSELIEAVQKLSKRMREELEK